MAGPPQTASDQLRHSHGLEQFFDSLREEAGCCVLDLGEFTQANVSYITSLGHKLYSEDFVQTLDAVFGPGEPVDTQSQPDKASLFLRNVLQYPPAHFDAVLAWDALEYLTRPMLGVVMDRLHTILRPQAALLACFHGESRDGTLPAYSFRIAGSDTLLLHPRGCRRRAQSFNNRAIEKLFERFRSVKFFLTRDHLREVIVRR